MPYATSNYRYDNLGREVATWRPEEGNKGESFRYNPAGQLINTAYNADNVWTGAPLNASSTATYTMTPDTLNWASVNTNGTVATMTSSALNQYTNVSGTIRYYDGNFNLSVFGAFSFSYDAEKRVTSVSKNGVTQVECTYDGLGRVVRRSEQGVVTLYTYDEWKPIMEWDSPSHWVAWNAYGAGPDEILYREANGWGQLRYHSDPHGNVTEFLDFDGDVIEQYKYDAFGTPTVSYWDGSYPRGMSWYGNRFMFQGREYLAAIQCYDFRHRMYKPNLGRFLQTDPTGFDAGDMNLFRYCGGDPVDRADPTGLIAVDYTWSALMYWQGSSLPGFSDILQAYLNYPSGNDSKPFSGSINVAETRGNWKDRNMANHVLGDGDLSDVNNKAETTYTISAMREPDGSLSVGSNLNWKVEKSYKDTAVVTTEITDHVRRWRVAETDEYGGIREAIKGFSKQSFRGSATKAAEKLNAKLEAARQTERRSQERDYHRSGAHFLDRNPALGRPVSAADIERALNALP